MTNNEGNLRKHMVMKHGAQFFVCAKCPMRCWDTEKMKSHLLIHKWKSKPTNCQSGTVLWQKESLNIKSPLFISENQKMSSLLKALQASCQKIEKAVTSWNQKLLADLASQREEGLSTDTELVVFDKNGVASTSILVHSLVFHPIWWGIWVHTIPNQQRSNKSVQSVKRLSNTKVSWTSTSQPLIVILQKPTREQICTRGKRKSSMTKLINTS